MKFTTIIGVAATLLGVAFASSAETEKVDAEIAALRDQVSGKLERAVSFIFTRIYCLCINASAYFI